MTRKELTYFGGVIIAIAACILVTKTPDAASESFKIRPVPEFTTQQTGNWINSKPLRWQDLRGKVVLIDFWTFNCWNCYRSFPWLNGLEAGVKNRDFHVIGIHTPESKQERVRMDLESKIREFELQHPIMVDNDFSYWNAMGSRYWPTFYLVDKQGQMRAVFIGEVHAGDERALSIESKISELLAENSGAAAGSN